MLSAQELTRLETKWLSFPGGEALALPVARRSGFPGEKVGGGDTRESFISAASNPEFQGFNALCEALPSTSLREAKGDGAFPVRNGPFLSEQFG